MLNRIAFTLAVLAVVALCPWVTTLILTIGKPATFAVFAPVAFVLWVSGTATILERN